MIIQRLHNTLTANKAVYKMINVNGVKIENTSIDYSIVLNNSLEDFILRCNKWKESEF